MNESYCNFLSSYPNFLSQADTLGEHRVAGTLFTGIDSHDISQLIDFLMGCSVGKYQNAPKIALVTSVCLKQPGVVQSFPIMNARILF